MDARAREMEEIDRWCDEREEATRRARRRVGRFVSAELTEAVEWLRVGNLVAMSATHGTTNAVG